MRRRLHIAVLLGAVVGVAPLGAQTDPAPPPAPHPCEQHADASARVCRAAYDAMSALLPSAALVAGGGNPSLGTAAGSGGFGDLTITLRGTYTKAVLPETGYLGASDTVRAARVWQMTLPRVDLRLGLLGKELPMGAASVDLLGSVIPIPRTATTAVRFGPQVRSLGTSRSVSGTASGSRWRLRGRCPWSA